MANLKFLVRRENSTDTAENQISNQSNGSRMQHWPGDQCFPHTLLRGLRGRVHVLRHLLLFWGPWHFATSPGFYYLPSFHLFPLFIKVWETVLWIITGESERPLEQIGQHFSHPILSAQESSARADPFFFLITDGYSITGISLITALVTLWALSPFRL